MSAAPTSFKERLKFTAKAKGIEYENVEKHLDVWNLRGHATDLAKLVPHIVAQAAGRDYSLVIVDPIYKCLGDRDENAAGDIGEYSPVGSIRMTLGLRFAFKHCSRMRVTVVLFPPPVAPRIAQCLPNR